MFFSPRSLAVTALAAIAIASSSCFTQQIDASPVFRAAKEQAVAAVAFPKTSFKWVVDPHAADPCTTEPGCHNAVKYGYDIVPVNITTDTNVVFQEAKRTSGISAVLNLDIYTQPGCGVAACHMVKTMVFFTKEECFNDFFQQKATEIDGKTTKLAFGGIYYEDLPTGELYAKFEKKNYNTKKATCTYEVRSGFKRWF